MKNWVMKSLGPIFLLTMVIIDTVATYVLWTNHWMVEENPLMLMALEVGWLYWVVKLVQLLLVLAIWKASVVHKWMRFATWIIAGFYFIVWFQFLLGNLIF